VIGRLTGSAIDKGADGCCVLDVQGVGYEVFVPLRSMSLLPAPPERVTLHVHTHVREDTFRLYGFENVLDRAAFREMLGVSGVGPKLAMAILSEMSASELASAVTHADKKRFATVSGIGKKMAERLVLELKDKVEGLAAGELPGAMVAPPPPILGRAGEVASALVALGFTRLQAEGAAGKVVQREDERPVETLIRQALATLG
jgi:Holliday junction DNA helicase RuvA